MLEVGRWKTFEGKTYKLKASAKTKTQLAKAQKRYGGRIVKLPKGSSDYKSGDRWGLYRPAQGTCYFWTNALLLWKEPSAREGEQ